ncbi:MAG TPA: M48 family metallopeptidase [Acidobacteriaceae bacterium]|nr:M48 family metallopeptidase [Acidobacteriaceae bacterium]
MLSVRIPVPSSRWFLLLGVAFFLSLASSFNSRKCFAQSTASQHQQNARPSPAGAAYTLPPDLLRKAVALTRVRTILAFGGTAWSLTVLSLVLILRWPVHLRNWVERRTARRWVQGLLFLPPAILFLSLISLPLAIYSQHVELHYGLSVQSWRSWAADQGKGLLLSVAVFTPLLLLLFWIIRRAPKTWWLWFWFATLPVIVLGVFISPLWIDPLFNHFSPLQSADPQLANRLERLAHHAGLDIPPSRMFLMRASEKVTGFNAYVTGMGASKRIVVWDTTIQKLPQDQILFIAAHEIGHYVLNHIYKGLAFTALLLFVLLWLAWLCVRWLVARWGPFWGIRSEDDWATLAIVVLVATCISFLSSPIANFFSRWEEHQADIFGQEAIHGLVPNPQQTAQQAFNALGRAYLAAPHPNRGVEFWLDSHPSIDQRATFALHYDPWIPGKQPRFFSK